MFNPKALHKLNVSYFLITENLLVITYSYYHLIFWKVLFHNCSSSGDWELAGEGEKETPIQKYQRLQCEMNELLEEIADLKVRRRFNLENSLSLGGTNTLVVNIHVFVCSYPSTFQWTCLSKFSSPKVTINNKYGIFTLYFEKQSLKYQFIFSQQPPFKFSCWNSIY